jgi:hypothetical protein
MLLSLRRRFVFLSNMKAASTTVETTLQPYAELQRIYPHNTKHFSLNQVRGAFPEIFSTPPFRDGAFVRFGVIRDPLSWICAWFNYRSASNLSDPTHVAHDQYCGSLSFREFASEVVRPDPRPFGRVRLQSDILATNGRLDCNFIIDSEKFEEDFSDLLELLDLRSSVERIAVRNVTQQKRILPDQVNWSAFGPLLDYLEPDFTLRERYLELRVDQREVCETLREREDGDLTEDEIVQLLSIYWESFAASVLHGPTEGVPRAAIEQEILQLDKQAFLEEHLPVKSASGAS